MKSFKEKIIFLIILRISSLLGDILSSYNSQQNKAGGIVGALDRPSKPLPALLRNRPAEFWFPASAWHSPVLAGMAIWGVTQQINNLFLSLQLKINKSWEAGRKSIGRKKKNSMRRLAI